jgi:lambda family phage portal protein
MSKPAIRPSLLDRVVGVFSPGAMRSRIRERLITDTMLRGYDSATPSRSTAGWRRGSTSADAEIAAAGPKLRDAMRDLVRNNPHAAKAVSSLVAYIIGEGIMPRATTGDRALDKKVNDLWDEFSKKADADGQQDIYGLQTLIAREMIEGGEVLIRKRNRRLSDGLPVPLQLQILESDLIDNSRNGPLPTGGFAVQGVEMTSNGERKAYWLWSSHPGNSALDPRWTLQSKAVPAREIAHVYEKQRTQVRGVPWGSPAMTTLRDLADYEAAEITRKKIESCTVGVVTGDDDSYTTGDVTPGVYDADGRIVERFEPGMFLHARGGKTISFHQPTTSGAYESWKRSILHTIAAGFRIPYSVLSGDLSQNSYASQKIGMADFARLVSTTQWQVIIPMACQPIWDWFTEAAYLAGKLPTPTIKCHWNPPEFPSADPGKDADAALVEMRSGLRTFAELCASKGRTEDDVIEEIAATNKKLDAVGIVLDSDPRRTTMNGQKQMDPAEQGAAADQPKPKE